MKCSLSASEYHSWQAYWGYEPWGPFRDNLHAAIISREIRRPQLVRSARSNIKLSPFMIVGPQERKKEAEEAAGNFISFLKAVSKQVKRND